MRFFIVLTVCLFSSLVWAAQSEYLHQPHISTRVMGMGGAYTSVADDYEALYYNPAGLARLENWELNLGIQAGATPTIINFYNDLSGAGSNVTNLTNVIQNYYGSHFSSRVGLNGTLAKPSWAIGLQPLDLTVEADIRAVATVGLQAYQDTTFQFGKAWNLNDDKSFNIGIAPKLVYRGYFEKDISALDLASNSSLINAADAQEGLAVDADFGMLYTCKAPEEGWFQWLKYAVPTLGFAVRNMVDSGFATNFHLYGKGSTTIPGGSGRLDRRFDFGATFKLPDFAVFHPRVMLEEHDMGSRYASFAKGFHLGGELLWKAFGWLKGAYRIGLSEGFTPRYLTLGVSLQMAVFNLDLATYSEEIGTTDSPRDSRRYMLKASLDF